MHKRAHTTIARKQQYVHTQLYISWRPYKQCDQNARCNKGRPSRMLLEPLFLERSRHTRGMLSSLMCLFCITSLIFLATIVERLVLLRLPLTCHARDDPTPSRPPTPVRARRILTLDSHVVSTALFWNILHTAGAQ